MQFWIISDNCPRVAGYGHIVPVTPIGKIVTIFYAVVGVPLFLLYLSNIGQIFATSFKWTYSRLCKCQIFHRRRWVTSHFEIDLTSSELFLSGFRKYRIDTLPQQIHPGLVELQKTDPSKVCQLATASVSPASPGPCFSRIKLSPSAHKCFRIHDNCRKRKCKELL